MPSAKPAVERVETYPDSYRVVFKSGVVVWIDAETLESFDNEEVPRGKGYFRAADEAVMYHEECM